MNCIKNYFWEKKVFLLERYLYFNGFLSSTVLNMAGVFIKCVGSLGYRRVCGLYLGSSSFIDSPRDSTRPTTARKTRSVPCPSVWFRVVRNRPHLQHQIAELQRQYDLLRQTCASLTKCHSKALKECEVKGESLGQPLSLSLCISL